MTRTVPQVRVAFVDSQSGRLQRAAAGALKERTQLIEQSCCHKLTSQLDGPAGLTAAATRKPVRAA